MPRNHMNLTYPKNVRFQCTRCALCCGDTEARPRHILMLKKDAQSISKTTSRPIEHFARTTVGHEPYVYEMKKTKDGKCLFLKKDTCTIYSSRPLVCRYYPFELKTIENGRIIFSSTEECPGIGRGKLLRRVHFEQLTRLASERIQ
jgi:Fe-S-cluster containining protein